MLQARSRGSQGRARRCLLVKKTLSGEGSAPAAREAVQGKGGARVAREAVHGEGSARVVREAVHDCACWLRFARIEWSKGVRDRMGTRGGETMQGHV